LLKKQNKTTTQNIGQPKHLTDLLTTDIKESRNTQKKYIAADFLFYKAIGFSYDWLTRTRAVVEQLC